MTDRMTDTPPLRVTSGAITEPPSVSAGDDSGG